MLLKEAVFSGGKVTELKEFKGVIRIQLCEFHVCCQKKTQTPKSLNQSNTALLFIVQQPEALKILVSD